MNSQAGFAAVNNTRLYYEMAGPKGTPGPAVVLIHGFTLDTRMWDDQFAVLAQSYRVLRYDMRGYGRSALPGRRAPRRPIHKWRICTVCSTICTSPKLP